MDGNNWLQISTQSVLILYSVPQSLKTLRRLENFTKYYGLPDMPYCQQLHLENSGSLKHPRLEEKKNKTGEAESGDEEERR